MPSEDMGYLMVNIQLPDAASLQRTDSGNQKGRKNHPAAHEEVEYMYQSVAGYSLLSNSMSSNAGFIFVAAQGLERCGKNRQGPGGRGVEYREFFVGVNEAQVFAFGPPPIPGLGSGSGFTIMIQDRAGNTPAYLAEQTTRFIQAATADGRKSASIFTTFRPSVPQR